jgi:hypothetical protein
MSRRFPNERGEARITILSSEPGRPEVFGARVGRKPEQRSAGVVMSVFKTGNHAIVDTVSVCWWIG